MTLGFLHRIEKKLVVSCQAEGDSPFNTPEGVSLFARAAEQGGAGGVRSEGLENLKAVRRSTTLPLIGIVKRSFPDGSVCITREASDIHGLIAAGADIIAVDGTMRLIQGESGPEFIRNCKKSYPGLEVIADVATVEEAVACYESGADAVSTTLRGYTPETANMHDDPFDEKFLQALVGVLPSGFPVIAEGKINNLETVMRIRRLGAWCIVVGTAITRPIILTKKYSEAYINGL